jgi:hypothetical protein
VADMQDARKFLQQQKAKKFLEDQKKRRVSKNTRDPGNESRRPKLMGDILAGPVMRPPKVSHGLSSSAPIATSPKNVESNHLPQPPPIDSAKPMPKKPSKTTLPIDEQDETDWLKKQIAQMESVLAAETDNVADKMHHNEEHEETDSYAEELERQLQAFEMNEKKLEEEAVQRELIKAQDKAALAIQCSVRQRKAKKTYLERKESTSRRKSASVIQKRARGMLVRKHNNVMRSAASLIQKRVRGMVARTDLNRKKEAVLQIQNRARGMLARKNVSLRKEAIARSAEQRSIRLHTKTNNNRVRVQPKQRHVASRVKPKNVPVASIHPSLSQQPQRPLSDTHQKDLETVHKITVEEGRRILQDARVTRNKLQNQLASLRQRNNQLSSTIKKAEAENAAIEEERSKLIAIYKIPPPQLTARIDSAIQAATAKLKEIRHLNSIEKDKLIRARDSALSKKDRILKALEKGMSEIRYQSFQQSSLRASVQMLTDGAFDGLQ